MSRKSSISLFLLVVIFLLVTAWWGSTALITPHRQPSPTQSTNSTKPSPEQPTAPPSTIATTSSVLGTNTELPIPATVSGLSLPSAKCQATLLNPQDPQSYLPDPSCTPGALNPAVTQDTISTTICVSGYTGTIRPPASYTNKLKLQQMKEYGFTDLNPKNYEEDHFISLELGGSPDDPKNLWPEPHPSYNEKDKVENYLHREVCAGRMSLQAAQDAITRNWYTVFLQIN